MSKMDGKHNPTIEGDRNSRFILERKERKRNVKKANVSASQQGTKSGDTHGHP